MYQAQGHLDIGATPYNPYSAHYPTQYGTAAAPMQQASFPTLPYFPPYPHAQQSRVSPPPDLPPSPPDLTSITPDIASRAIQRLISSELRDAGFESAEPLALHRIEREVVAFVEQVFLRAHEYANLANRAGAIAPDVLLACDEFKLPSKVLRAAISKGAKRRKRDGVEAPEVPTLLPPPSRSPSPDLLPSDDEGVAPVVPVTLRSLPPYFPDLPPKHTYLRTPASPPKRAALPSLEKKLKTAGLVQESLQHLLLATEDNTGQEDGELLGHIVNWEMGAHPRKRWKVGP